MESTLIQLMMVLFLGGIATYDTLKSRKRKSEENADSAGKIFNLQN
jgi:hypothetical protein